MDPRDVERAAETPFGGTIADGLYTLSLGPALLEELLSFDQFAASLNYGYERVRFPAALPVGSRLRMRARVVGVVEGPQGVRVHNEQVFEREGQERPVAVAESVAHLIVD
jgi:acyl dehydratase